MNSDEVVQAYVSYPGTPGLKELKAFKRIHLKSGNSRLVKLAIPANELRKWNPDKNKWELTKGQYKLVIGSHSRDEKVVYTFRV
jgi:beta-glucosidase